METTIPLNMTALCSYYNISRTRYTFGFLSVREIGTVQEDKGEIEKGAPRTVRIYTSYFQSKKSPTNTALHKTGAFPATYTKPPLYPVLLWTTSIPWHALCLWKDLV